jgi:signal transduction histidine kinase
MFVRFLKAIPVFNRLYEQLWLPTPKAHTREDLLMKRLTACVLLPVFSFIILGAIENEIQILIGALLSLLGSIGFLIVLLRGYGHFARPVYIIFMFAVAYLSRIQDPRPLDSSDSALQILIFEVGLLAAVLLRNRWLKWGYTVLVVLGLVFFPALIERFGHTQMPLLSPLIVYSMWTTSGLLAIAILDFHTGLLQRSEQQINLLLEEAQQRNAELQNTNEELQNLQEQVVRIEKLQLVERFVANISHRLNSPLAALHAANKQLNERSAGYAKRLLIDLKLAKEADRKLIAEYMTLLYEGHISLEHRLSYRERRQLLSQLAEQLSPYATGAYSAEQLAEQFESLGFHKIALIQANLELLGECRQVNSLLQIHRATIQSLLLLSQNLRTFSQQNRFEKPTVLDPVAELRGLIDEFCLQNRGISIKLNSAIPDSLRLQIRKTDLRSIVLNLLVNAADAQAGQGHIQVRFTQEGQQLVVTVQDAGQGISAELQSRIFEPFVTSKSIAEGMGMGLYVSRITAESYQGILTFRSAPGETVFTLKLPSVG